MSLQLTDGELNRMARSRSRDLLLEIGRATDVDLYGATIKQSMIMRNVRPTPKSMKRAEARIAGLPACIGASVWSESGVYANAMFAYQSEAMRTEFEDEGIIARSILYAPERGIVIGPQAFLTEHLIVRLCERVFNPQDVSTPLLRVFAEDILNVAFGLDTKGVVDDYRHTLTRDDGRQVVVPMKLHSSNDNRRIWAAMTIWEDAPPAGS